MKSLVLIACWLTMPSSVMFHQTGTTLPNMMSNDVISGRPISLEKEIRSHSQPTLVVFWSKGCHVCVEELEQLKTYNKPLITIAYEGNSVKDFLEDRLMVFTTLAGNEKIFSTYGILVVPYWYLVDSNMKIIKQSGGIYNE